MAIYLICCVKIKNPLGAPFRSQKADSRGEDKHTGNVVVVQIWQVQSVKETLLIH